MFNDPKFKNLINDVRGILGENIKKHFEEILPESMSDQVILAAEEIEEISEGARTAEVIGKVMKDHFYAGVREAQVQPTNEMSAEFYRRVVAELKMPSNPNNPKIKAAFKKGAERSAAKAVAKTKTAHKLSTMAGDATEKGMATGEKKYMDAGKRASDASSAVRKSAIRDKARGIMRTKRAEG